MIRRDRGLGRPVAPPPANLPPPAGQMQPPVHQPPPMATPAPVGNPYTAPKPAPPSAGPQKSFEESIPIETKQISAEPINVYQQAQQPERVGFQAMAPPQNMMAFPTSASAVAG